MQQTKVLETWVGLFVALGLVGLFFLAMKVSNLADLQTNEKSYRIYARFQNAGSLRERAPVSMAGVRIGRVSSIRFDKETYEAVVEMRIDPEYDTLPVDSTANVLTAGLLGEQYIGLSPGGSEEFLKEGDVIELSQSAMVLEQVISKFLFNKAESNAENKGSPSADATAADVAPATAIVQENLATPSSGKIDEKAVPAAEEGGAALDDAKMKQDKEGETGAPVQEIGLQKKAGEESVHQGKAAAGKGEESSNHKPKAGHKSTDATPPSHKPKVVHGKGAEETAAAQKPKAGKGGEEVSPAHKPKAPSS